MRDVAEAVPATPEEFKALLIRSPKKGAAPQAEERFIRWKSRVRRTGRKSRIDGKKQLHQLDLGLVDRRLTVSAVNGGSISMGLKGRVLGDVSFLSGSIDGRIDLGTVPSTRLTKDVVLLAERPNLDLTLDTAATNPSFLKVKLESLPPIDGRNHCGCKA